MAQENAEQEPTMEEILASIRRIINEDDDEKPAEAAAAPQAAPAPEPAREPAPAPVAEADPEPEPEPDALELTERVEEAFEPEFVAPEPEPEPEPQTNGIEDDIMILDREP